MSRAAIDDEGRDRALTLPNLIIPGANRAGSTALFSALARHPQVLPASAKETGFFQPVRYGLPLAPIESYARYFGAYRDEPVVVEATPDYLLGGRETAEVVNTVCAPRVLVILRDPVARLVSYYRFMQARLQIDSGMSFTEYLRTCEALPEHRLRCDRSVNAYAGLWGGHYVRFLRPWLDVFGGRLRVVFFDDMVDDTKDFFAGISAWLGIGAFDDDATIRHENASTTYRFPVLQRLSASVARRVRPVLHRHPGVARTIRRTYDRVNSRPDRLDPVPVATLERVAALYASSNAELASLLTDSGVVRLPRWLADR